MDDTAQQSPRPGLSPPWYTLWNKIDKAVGADPGFSVQPLQDNGDGTYTVVITSQGGDPTPLAAVLKKSHTLGNITVNVEVQELHVDVLSINTPGELVGALNGALKTNPYFVQAIQTQPSPFYQVPSVVAVFTASVIQFYNDDLSDYYRNFNGVTADVFTDILLLDYGNNVTLATTTVPLTTETGGTDDGAQGQGGNTGGGQG
ncbi:MAG: hypothetical protein M3441_05435 [Chloroflexota bacterium]|nr:hypothetical protein [Chloroflexota bacterium]